jgi:RHS repeat-associated protein
VIDFNGAKVDSVYDYEDAKYGAKLGRLMGILDQSGQPLETYEYDGYGRRSKVVNGSAVSEYGYDDEGRLTGVSRKEGASLQWAVAYAYDATTGQHTSTVTAHTKIDYEYDLLGRLKTVGSRSSADGVTWSAKREATYGYTPAGNVRTVTVPEVDGWNLVSSYAYDAKRPWASDLTHQRRKVDQGQEQVTALAEHHYQRTGDGQIRRLVESVGLPDGDFRYGTATYEYDALNRLTRESYDLLSDGKGDYTKSYVLDVVGNRRRLLEMLDGGPVRAYVSLYDERDRLEVRYELGQDTLGVAIALSPTFYEYLPTGEQIRETTYSEPVVIPPNTGGVISEPTNGQVVREQNSTWDYRGRLQQAEVLESKSTTTVAYAFDPDGNRVREEQTGGGNPGMRVHVPDAINPTGYTQTIDELADRVFAQATLRVATASHAFGRGPLSRTHFGYDGNGNPDAGQRVVAAYLMDVHSGVRQQVTDSGVLAANYRFDAFGVTVASVFGGTAAMQDAAAANRELYRGERLLAVLGRYDLRARLYDPATGRFGSVDPYAGRLAEPLPLHRYIYGHADALNNSDPSGQWSLSVSITIGALSGGLLGFGYGGYLGYKAAGNTIFSWKPWAYALVGLAIGAASGAAIGAGAHGLYSLMAGTAPPAGFTSFFRDLFAISHPSFKFALAAGFVAGIAWGAVTPSFPFESLATVVGGSVFSASMTTLYQTLISNSFHDRLLTLRPDLFDLVYIRPLWSNAKGRPVTLQSLARTGALWGTVFAGGFAVGFGIAAR